MKNVSIPVTKVHSYNVSVAADVGINAAVIFYNICYWVEENTANERNFINGEYWTYNTVNAFKTLFPEMSYEQVRNALRKLENAKYIKSAFLNEDTRDRTKWYTVVDKDKWITSNKCNCENSHMDCDKSQKEHGESTDDNNIYNNINTDTDNNQSNNKHSNNSHKTLSVERAASECEQSEPKNNQSKPNRKKEANALFEQLWSLYPLKKGKASVSDTQKLKLLDIGYEELERAVSRYVKYVDSVDYLHYKNGSTFFNSGYVDYLDENYTDGDANNNTHSNYQQAVQPKHTDANNNPEDRKEAVHRAMQKAAEQYGEQYGEQFFEGMSDGDIEGMLGLLGIDVV